MNKRDFMTFVAILCMLIVVAVYYISAAGRPGRIVIPAGNTYLGPNDPSKTK